MTCCSSNNGLRCCIGRRYIHFSYRTAADHSIYTAAWLLRDNAWQVGSSSQLVHSEILYRMPLRCLKGAADGDNTDVMQDKKGGIKSAMSIERVSASRQNDSSTNNMLIPSATSWQQAPMCGIHARICSKVKGKGWVYSSRRRIRPVAMEH